jgi:preprotein translocase subunit SecG
MEFLQSILIIVQLVAALGVIVLVLLQQGKGADMGAAFGSGSSGSIFGASGSSNFLSRTTAILAAIFFVSTLGITFIGANKAKDAGVLSHPTVVTPKDASVATPPAPQEPVTPKDGTVPK